MPVKNAGAWIGECLESVVNQSFRNWELLITDDHSTDDSLEWIRKFSAADARIKPLINEGSGITCALDLAFRKSVGRFITRMDADDLMPEYKLERFHKELTADPDCVVTGKVKYFSTTVVSAGYLDYEAWLNERIDKGDPYRHIFRECVIASPNWMISRKNLEAIAPFADHQYPEDYDLVFRWYEKKMEIRGIDAVTHFWREHGKRTSRTDLRYDQQHFFRLKLHWFVKLHYQQVFKVFLFGKNRKERMCRSLFSEHGIPVKVLTPENYNILNSESHALVLVCVYPERENRNLIEAYLDSLSKRPTFHWWYV